MKQESYLVINSKVLPPVFEGVVKAKELLADKTAKSTSEAVRIAGVSRSAFYKYRDFVCRLDTANTNILSLNATLDDKVGVFSTLTTILYENGANIITVHQGAPVNGLAPVTLTIAVDNMKISLEELLSLLRNAKGIISIKSV